MVKCKICGEIMSYHVSQRHLDTHGLTRKQYNAVEGRDQLYIIGKETRSEAQKAADWHNTEERIRLKLKHDRSKGKCFVR